MNAKCLVAWLLSLAPCAASAQEGVLAVHPASNPGGRLLTMGDVVGPDAIYPENRRVGWKREETGMPEAYFVGKSLWLRDSDGQERVIAQSGDDNVTYGQSVSRNEFGIKDGRFWSPDRGKIAFYRKDESRVTDFPLLDITTRTGSLRTIKYPMNGMESERVSLGIHDLGTGRTVYADVTDFGEDRYLTNVTWSPDSRHIFIQVLDRSQKHCRLNMYSAEDGSFERTVLTEDNDRFTEPLDPLYFVKGTGLFVYRTDNRDGYRNLYLCDTTGTVRRLTAVDADVAYVGNDGRWVYYTSAEVSPVENHLFRMELRLGRGSKSGLVSAAKFGEPQRLTQEEGWHSIVMKEDCTQYYDSYSSLNVPRVINLRSCDGSLKENVLTAADPYADIAQCEVDFGTVRSADGKYDNYYRLFKPLGFDPSKRYPVIVYVYGGPHSQMVQDKWLGSVRPWEMLMAQRGYVVYVQDNRGTQNRGADYEKAIHRHCGQAEMADQMEGVKMLRSLPWVDSDRIGVHGWSYGGFMTISLMVNYPETFKVAVAGGPVIDWKWYEIMYGERYMDTQESNPEGFAQTSLLPRAKDLRGKLLICQGAVDETVVWQHSLSFVRECVKSGVQLDYFPYPCAEHNVMGKDRIHLMDKVTAYFDDWL